MTGKNRWIAFCLYFTSFAQAALGMAHSIRSALRPGMISFPPPEANPIFIAMVFPNPPFDEYRFCTFQLWETGEVTYVALSLAYGTLFLLSTAHTPVFDFFLVKDALALLIIVYSGKQHDGGRTRVDGMPSLLDKILHDATINFLVLSTGHLLLLFFDILTPVSDHPVDLCSAAHHKLHIGSD